MEISLRLDVEVFDAKNIIRWLENKEVTKYLNEDVKVRGFVHLLNSRRLLYIITPLYS